MNKKLSDKPHQPTTKLVHLGRDTKEAKGFVNPPLYKGSTVLFPTVKSLTEGGYGYWYGRKGSPTYESLEAALNELEHSDDTILTPSGLSAITTALLALLKTGDHLLVTDSVYQPTRNFCDTTLKALGIEVTYYDPRVAAGIKDLIKENTKLIFLESPGSQSFEIQDIPAIVEAAQKASLLTLIDNTWATPLFLTPLTLGVDVSIHSGTKYFIGHADAMIGTVSSNGETAQKIRQMAYSLGLCAGPDDVQLALRGLRTLGVRLAHHERAAIEFASWLEERPEVECVLHPALPSHPDHDIFKRDFKGSSGLFTAIFKPVEQKKIEAMLDGLELFAMGWSWGGYESLALPFNPASYRTATNWNYKGQAIRFHIGHENMDDLKTDFTAGLERLK